jgi:putative PIN family toxin of toxin-antitoxin system
MLRVVADTNVLVSAFASRKGPPGQVYGAWLARGFVLVTSEYILNEFSRIAKSKLKFDDRAVVEATLFILSQARVVSPLPVSHDMIHLNDWPILGTALAGEVDFLVTGDKLVLKLNKFSNIHIITPVNFLKILNN